VLGYNLFEILEESEKLLLKRIKIKLLGFVDIVNGIQKDI